MKLKCAVCVNALCNYLCAAGGRAAVQVGAGAGRLPEGEAPRDDRSGAGQLRQRRRQRTGADAVRGCGSGRRRRSGDAERAGACATGAADGTLILT